MIAKYCKLFHRYSLGINGLKIVKDQNPEMKISQLQNGIKLITERSSFPTQNDIGICFRVGHRDENPTERGALHNLKQRLFHTSEHDQLENLQMIQIHQSEEICRTGCMFDMIIDQETTYYKSQFLEEDLDKMAEIVLKLSLTPKQIFDSEKNPYKQPDPVIPFEEQIIKAAFQGQQMGNSGTEGQILNIDKQAFSQFQEMMFTPQNMAIGYAGTLSHEEFRAFIEEKLSRYPQFLNRKFREAEHYKFTPGTIRIENEDDELHIAIVFEGLKWSHPKLAITQIAEKILGSSQSWSSGGPGKGMRARTTINLMNRIASIESASAINTHFIETGLCGIKVSGDASDRDNLLQATIKEYRDMIEPMQDKEFLRGRNCLQSLMQLNLERQADRLEENVKNIYTVQRLTYQYMDMINDISKEDMLAFLRERIFETVPVVIYQGKGANQLPDMEWVLRKLRS